MNYKNILIALGLTAGVGVLTKVVYDRVQTARNSSPADAASPKVKKLVSETLKQHEGEDGPFVHAFAQAVE